VLVIVGIIRLGGYIVVGYGEWEGSGCGWVSGVLAGYGECVLE
jgi:hypothetical protein